MADPVTQVPVFALNLPPRLERKSLRPRLELLGTYRPVGDVIAFDRTGRLARASDPDGTI